MCMKEGMKESRFGDKWKTYFLLGLFRASELIKKLFTPGPAIIIPDKPNLVSFNKRPSSPFT